MRWIAGLLMAVALTVGGTVWADCGDDPAHHVHETTPVAYHPAAEKSATPGRTARKTKVATAKPVVVVDPLRIVKTDPHHLNHLKMAKNVKPAPEGSIG